MKSQKGITMVSLILYVIGMAIVVGIISTISVYFYKNTQSIQDTSDNAREFSTFNTFFQNDINKNKVVENTEKTLAFSDGTKYTFDEESKGIYRNKVKLCNYIENLTFSRKDIYEKTIISVYIKIGENEIIEKNVDYAVEN